MDMNLITFWVATIIGSFGAQFVNELRLFKDVADAGYKVDMQRMKDFQNRVMPNTKKINILSLFMPIFNIAYVCKNIINYNNNRPMILDQLNAIGVLEEMTGYEKREYLRKPTALNAIIIPLKIDIKLKNAITITVTNDDGTNKYYCELNKEKAEINLLKVEGPLADLSFDEQEKKFLEEISRAFKYVKDNYGSFENYQKSLNNTSKDIVKTQSTNTDMKTKELDDVKKEEFETKEKPTDEQENIKVFKKVKKR